MMTRIVKTIALAAASTAFNIIGVAVLANATTFWPAMIGGAALVAGLALMWMAVSLWWKAMK